MLNAYNKLTDLYSTDANRTDMVIAKIDGSDPQNRPIGMKYQVRYWPSLLLFRPGDSQYPIKYIGDRTYDAINKFLWSFKPLNLSQPAVTMAAEPVDLKEKCKAEVDLAVHNYQQDLYSRNLLLTETKLRYYQGLEAEVGQLKRKDEVSEKEMGKLQKLKKEAEEAEKKVVQEFEQHRKQALKEVQQRFTVALKRIDQKMGDIHSLMAKREIASRATQKASISERMDKRESGEDEDQPVVGFGAQLSDLVIRVALPFLVGVVVMGLYQRLAKLNDIVKVVPRSQQVEEAI